MLMFVELDSRHSTYLLSTRLYGKLFSSLERVKKTI